jgi:hypothetical protein
MLLNAAAAWRRDRARDDDQRNPDKLARCRRRSPRARRAWDALLTASSCPRAAWSPYERRDRRHVDAAERADDAAYRPASCTSRAYRDGGYADDGRIEVGSL